MRDIVVGETLEEIVGSFSYWFVPRLADFSRDPARLPVDQHSLISLVAPRGYISLNALQDDWSNPKGTQMAHIAAQEVYTWLNAESNMGLYYRPGEHGGADTWDNEWGALIGFADHVFFGKPVPEDINDMPWTGLERGYSWEAPVTTSERKV